MVSQKAIAEALGRLALLRRFPGSPLALAELGEILKEMCQSDEDLAALVRGVVRTQDEWCGPLTLRRIRDGIINPDGPYTRM